MSMSVILNDSVILMSDTFKLLALNDGITIISSKFICNKNKMKEKKRQIANRFPFVTN